GNRESGIGNRESGIGNREKHAASALCCHPERSEGSVFRRFKQIPRCARDDNIRSVTVGPAHAAAAGPALLYRFPIPDSPFPAFFNPASRSWNSALVTSSRSSIGLSTRSLAPSRRSADWLSGLASPVITSTG